MQLLHTVYYYIFVCHKLKGAELVTRDVLQSVEQQVTH
jgi:hypothetical protein